MKKITPNSISMPLLYIHIPFCDSKCNYCAFNSYTNLNHLKKEYYNALKKQLESENVKYFKTLFIGGGTPSTMPISFYEKLFNLISPYLKYTKEITIEANPNTSYEWLKEIKNFGITRISFGVQSFNNEKLKFLNRNHSSLQAIKAIENAQKAGFENINIDLIYSTAIDSKKLLQKDLEIAFSLPISHISAYSLTIEENTKWEGDFSKRKEDEELEVWFIDKIKEKFNQYEISNFGKECEHNLSYWRLESYVGIGAGAVGFNKEKKIRYYTHNNVYEYLKNPTKLKIEKLTDNDLKKEKIFLGLRSKVGFDESLLNNEEKKRAKILVEENKLIKKNNIFYSKDFLLADALTTFILN